MRSKKFFSILFVFSILVSCSVPKVVELETPNDNQLSCTQLDTEIKKTEDIKAEGENKWGINTTNIAATLFWLPGLAATYLNVQEAKEAADNRIEYLRNLKLQKNCN